MDIDFVINQQTGKNRHSQKTGKKQDCSGIKREKKTNVYENKREGISEEKNKQPRQILKIY